MTSSFSESQMTAIIEATGWYVQVMKLLDELHNDKRIAPLFVAHLIGDIE